jgi:uncharacterized MAPEG superfamily protein
MTTELWMLVLSALLAPALTVPVLMGRQSVPGALDWGLGNRDKPLETPEWVGRAERAHRNLLENLPSFIALVLTAHVIGVHSALAVWGSMVFFGARVAHAAVYIKGITKVRTGVFFLSQAGQMMILIAILTA